MFKNKLTYQYQPIVDLIDLRLIRHEALLRIDEVSDIEGFARGLERTGQIIELDLHTLSKVVSLHEQVASFTALAVAINVSAISLVDREFQSQALALLERRSDSVDISFEITESAPITDMKSAADFVRDLQASGCSVGMDDYGDGYANLEIVKQLHLDYLKLSSCLTTNLLASDIARRTIAEALRVSNARGIKVVAEHIDNIRQYLVLKDMGIHYGQGWLFAKAGPLINDPEQFQNELGAKIYQGIQDSF
jgi:EAL domain-containing protein (putative c-di-GMP-specific phosphodiesterase class I)